MSRRDDEIIEAYLNGEADDVELRAWLRRDEAHVDAFVAACDLHWQLKDVVIDRASAPGIAGMIGRKPIDEPRVTRGTWRIAGLALAAAVAIAGAVVAIVLLSGGDAAEAPVRRDVAVMISENGAAWAEAPDGELPAGGSMLVSGRYELTSGSVVIETLRGATVTLTGPVTVSLETDMRAFVHLGYIEARVPPTATGFEVATPTMSVVDLGTEFGVTVDELGDAWVDVFDGEVVATALDGNRRRIGPSVSLSAGDRATSPLDTRELVQLVGPGTPRMLRQHVKGPIHLGNLFDDDKAQSLVRAIASDTMAAVADAGDLGVWRVSQGGDSVQEMAPDVWLDFRQLGWGFSGWGAIANDVWTGRTDGGKEPIAGIRTTGTSEPVGSDRLEQGIGIHADASIVFDLDEIRRAGRLHDHPMRLRVDRAGINDDVYKKAGRVTLAVVVTSDDGSVAAYINGRRVHAHADEGNVWRVDSAPPALASDGVFTSFDVPIAASARYVALVATGGGDGIGNDHAVFSGVRLELESE